MKHTEIFAQLKGHLIVSCQALPEEPLHSSYIMSRMAFAAFEGGAKGIRSNSVEDIKAIKETVSLPVIGLIKKVYEGEGADVYITPTEAEVDALVKSGCDIIAMDATKRVRPGGMTISEFFPIIRKKYPDVLFMADCSTYEEGMEAQRLGFDCVGTTLSGYNDVNAAAIGEGAFGAAKGFSDFLCLTFGTGIGGGIILGGKVLRGSGGVAGEVGHLITHKDGLPCGCGGRGCYEQYASTTALVRDAKKVCPSCENGRIIFQEMAAGNTAVKGAVDKWIEEIACGLASLIHTFNPPCIVLGGGIMNEPYIQEGLETALRAVAMESFLKGKA